MKRNVDVLIRIIILTTTLFTFQFAIAADSKVPFGGTAYLSNAVGIGTFIPGYAHAPSFTTSLTLAPWYELPAFLDLNPWSIGSEFSLSAWWLDSYNTSAYDANNRVTYSDLSLYLDAAKLGDWKAINLSLSPYVEIIGPISKASRAMNRAVGLGVGTSLAYKVSDFTFSWAPSFNAWVYTSPEVTADCNQWGSKPGLPPVINPQNVNFDLDQYLQALTIVPNQNRGANGRCQVAGRQSIGVLTNTVKATWSKNGHSVQVRFGWYLNFLRGISDRPELRGLHASNQNFTEATLGKIAYTYKIPVDFDFRVSAGIVSYQGSYDKQGKLRFPFFDFVTPGKNQTELFLQFSAGI